MNTESSRRTSPYLTLFIGIIIGLIVASVLFFIKDKISQSPTDPSVESRGLLLSIDNPKDGDVLTSKTVEINGRSGKDAFVVLTGTTEDKMTKTTSAKFSFSGEVVEGANQITISVFDNDTGQSLQKTINLLYLSQESAGLNLKVAQASSDDANEKIEQLREKIATSSADPSEANFTRNHVIGSVKAIKGSIVILETTQGVKLVFTDDLTEIYSVGESKTKIALANLEIGDLLAVEGLGEEEVLGLSKTIVRLEKVPARKLVYLGRVEEVTQEAIEMHKLDDEKLEFSVIRDSNTAFLNESNEEIASEQIKQGSTLITIGNLDDEGNIVAAKIFLIAAQEVDESSSATPSATP